MHTPTHLGGTGSTNVSRRFRSRYSFSGLAESLRIFRRNLFQILIWRSTRHPLHASRVHSCSIENFNIVMLCMACLQLISHFRKKLTTGIQALAVGFAVGRNPRISYSASKAKVSRFSFDCAAQFRLRFEKL